MVDFSIRALHAALDAERRARGLTWAALTREIGGPNPHAIRSSSFSGMGVRAAVNGNVVMAALRWLNRTPESFIAGHPDASTGARLPDDLPPQFFGHWDLEGLYAAVDAERSRRGLTWTGAAAQMGVGVGTLKSYSDPNTFVGFPAAMRVTQWLDRPLTDFILRDGLLRNLDVT